MHVVIPTTVGTYMRALYSSTTVAAQEERRSTRVYQRRAANPTLGSAVDSRRAGAAEACALHAGNALVHASSTMHNDSMRDALRVVRHKGASCIAEHVRRDVGADVERIASCSFAFPQPPCESWRRLQVSSATQVTEPNVTAPAPQNGGRKS